MNAAKVRFHEQQPQKTAIARKTLNPVWNADFVSQPHNGKKERVHNAPQCATMRHMLFLTNT
jgi:hypothetical protein